MPTSKKPKRVTYVSRAVYQKVVEENRRLKEDIWQIVMRPASGDASRIGRSWKDKFAKDAEFKKLLHEHAVKYVKDHPDSVAAQILKEHPPEPNRCVECGCQISPTERYCAECLCEDDCDPFA